MGAVYAVLGVLLIAAAMIDAVWTTLTTGGGGPITTRLSQSVWRGALFVQGRRSERSHRLLLALGTLILIMIMSVWIVLLWTGWTLLFSAEPGAVVQSTTLTPADLPARIYFTGYTLFTLGMGNYVPQGGLWQILTSLASLNGLTLITLSITYLIPVISAATQKRQLAAVIADLGRTPHSIVERAWTGTGFEGITTYLAQLGPMIELHAERHAAYPVLHYFHSPSRRTALSPRLAVLDEALLLLTTGVAPEVRLPAAAVEPVQHAIEGLLATLDEQYITKAGEPPPAPSLTALEAAGIPLAKPKAFRKAVEARRDHRRLLRAFVEGDGWEWNDVREDQGAS